ncbi:MAG: hypothetical protein KC996_03980 [Phycisphaerales bacterium]|nr:hypothetical protein [Phycisphaerales bacterium]
MLTATGAASLLLVAVGCSTPEQHANRSADLPEPVALAPMGQVSGQGSANRPDPIRITDPNVAVRHWITPTIIDTRAFDVQIQVDSPWTGPIDTVKNHLPAHKRDKTLAEGTPSMMPVGIANGESRTTPGAQFPSISQTGWAPPDPTLAVGPNHIVETVNSLIAFYDKAGNLQFSRQLGDAGSPGFFEPQGAGGFTFDPKCMYDHNTGRFIVVALETYGSTESWIDIAVSDDSDPNGTWYKYRTDSVIQVGANEYWVDYPGIGFDDNAFYVTGNLFKLNGPSSDGFAGPLFRIFNKTPLLNGDPVQIADIVPDFNASVQVAQSYGSAPRCFFLSRESSSELRVWTINNPLGSATLQSTTVAHASASSPSNAAPNLNGGTLDVLDGRLMNVHWRDGNLYAAHGIDGSGGRTKARWYHIATNNWPSSGSPSLVQQGDIEGTGSQHYFFPAIASDSSNNIGLVMARSSSSEYANVRIAGHLDGDALGTMSAPEQVDIGSAGYNGRWGDYFDLTIDPSDDRTFWYVGMHAENFGWQTVIGSFTLAAPCEADITGNGELDIFDVFAFLNLFNSGDLDVDYTGDGVLDIFDVFAYLDLFNAGCP